MFGIAVVITDSAGNGVHVNSQWQALTGSRAPGDAVIAAFDSAERADVATAFESARRTGASNLACHLSTSAGPVRVELRICRITTANGGVQGFAVGIQRRTA